MKPLKTFIETKYYHYIAVIILLILLNLFMIKVLFSEKLFTVLLNVITSTIFPFLISFIIVYIFRPVLLWIEQKSHIRTWVSALLFMGFLLISLLMFIEFFIPLLFTQLNNLIREFPHYKEQLHVSLSSFEQKHEILQTGMLNRLLDQFFTQTSTVRETNLIRTIMIVIKKIVGIIWIGLLVPIIIFLMVKDYEVILQSFLKLIPKSEQETCIVLFKRIDKKLGLYIRGQLLVFTYMFLGSFALFSLIGLKHSFLFAVLFAITNFIPYLGPYLGGIPVSIYAYLQSPHTLIFVLLIIFFLQQFDGDIGQPIIFGKQLDLHPLIIIVCMAVGSALFGIIGLIIAIPLFIIIKEVYLAYNSKVFKLLHLDH